MLEKLAAAVGTSNLHICAAMPTRKAKKGRTALRGPASVGGKSFKSSEIEPDLAWNVRFPVFA
jgi:hypothetical protein